MEVDPEVCSSSESKILHDYDDYISCLDDFQQQAALRFRFTGTAADMVLGHRTMFLAHNTPLYPRELAQFPTRLLKFLESSARTLPGGVRLQLMEALAFLIYEKMIDFAETLPVLMELQTLGDEMLQEVAYSNVTNSITQLNDDSKNKALQVILLEMLQQQKDEAKAERALITLSDLYQKKVWSDAMIADAICMACLHQSSRVMIAALSFLLDFEEIEEEEEDDDDDSDDDSDDDDDDDDSDDDDEIEDDDSDDSDKIEDDDDDGDDSDSKDDQSTPPSQILLNKVSHKGTTSSKKKKAKLQHVAPNMKQQPRLSSEKNPEILINQNSAPHGFSKSLFSRLRSSSKSFEVRMMMIGVIAQTVGLKKVILLDFYSYLKKYAMPGKRHVTTVLAAAVQACHKEVPRLAVEPLFNQIKYEFVEHELRLEVMTIGMNAVRGMRLRMPELMADANESKEKKGEFSDLNAAIISLGAMKKLLREPIKYRKHIETETYVVDKGHYASICMLRNGTNRLTKEQERACDRYEYITEHLPGYGTIRSRWARLPRRNVQEEQKKPAASEAKIAGTRQEKNKKRKHSKIAKTRQEKNKKWKHSGKQFSGRKATVGQSWFRFYCS